MGKISKLAFGAAAGLALAAMGDVESGSKGINTWNVGMFAQPLKGAVAVDGELGDWDLSGQILTGEIPHADRYSVRTAAMWDEENLYLSFVWRDPTPMHSQIDPMKKAQKGWVDDAVQLRLQVGGVNSWATIWCCRKNVQAFALDFYTMPEDAKGRHKVWASEPGGTALGDSGAEMMTKAAADGAGWTTELRVPWATLTQGKKAKFAAGEEIRMGLEFMWGNDAGDWPIARTTDCYSGWEAQTGFFWVATDAWGKVKLCAERTPNTRSYKPEATAAYGVVPVRAKIPKGKEKFTLVLEDRATGRRVRTVTGGHPVKEAKVGEDGGMDVVEALWDGLDDLGKPAAPGKYRVHGLAMDHIGLKYKMSFYNPGTPPWDNETGTGGWGADHSRAEFAVASGKNVIFGSKYPEGGYGIWAVGPEGKKVWSEKRGARAMSANEKHVYVLGGYYNENRQLLFRLDPATGAYVDFKGAKGETLECPHHVKFPPHLAKGSEGKVMNIAASPDDRRLVMALDDGRCALWETQPLRVVKFLPTAVKSVYPLGEEYRDVQFGVITPVHHTPLAFDGTRLYYFQRRDGALVEFNVNDNTVRRSAVAEKFGMAEAIALSRDGKKLYVADNGADMQVKAYDLASGKRVGEYGRRGGRARTGKFDAAGMRETSAVAEDHAGNVWAVEFTEYPRRVSVWSGEDGRFLKHYVGNAFYCGSGTFLHDTDPGRAYAGGTEFRIDIEKGTYEPEAVIWNPDPKKGGCTFRIPPGMHGIGPVFKSKASGQEREYYFVGIWGSTGGWQLYMKSGEAWRPVSAMCRLGVALARDPVEEKTVQAPGGEWSGLSADDMIVWNDLDGDGYVTRGECEVRPAAAGPHPYLCDWGTRPDGETLDVHVRSGGNELKWWRCRPARYAADGAPVYTLASIKEMGESRIWEMGDIAPATGEDLVVRFTTVGKKGMIVATDKEGRYKWQYRDWWHGVHGSHNSPSGNPNGRVFGAIMITGFADAGGDCGGVVMVRGNNLHDYWLTTDGLYLDKVFKGTMDGKLLPPTVEEARAMKFEELVGHGEPFMGWFGKQDDGKIRSIHCNFALASHICEVTGFDSVVRWESGDFEYTAADAVKADEFNRELAADANRKPRPYKFGTWAAVKGEGVTAQVNLAKTEKGIRVTVNASGDTSPWKNGGKDFAKLFKTGDCFDLQLGAEGRKESSQRLVFANHKGKTVVVQMRPVAPDAGENEKVTYESPVTALAFDSVRVLPVEVKTKVSANGWSLEAEVPWGLIGIGKGEKFKGDFGVILSDPEGMKNVARIYHFNKHTGLTCDLPNEARLPEGEWGEMGE